jgi:hypothetical protein
MSLDKHLPSQLQRRGLDYQHTFLSKAFEVVTGRDYNRVSYALREKRQRNRPLFYEIVLREDQPWEYLRDQVYPSFIRYLKYKGMDPASGGGLIVSLFLRDQFYLIEAPEFLKVFCEIEGIDAVTFHRRVLKWLSQTSP